MNVLPSPGLLRSCISPPSRFDSSRLIASPRPVPPYLPVRACVRLLKRFEDDPLLLRRDADAGIRDLERDHGGRVVEGRMFDTPPFAGAVDAQAHTALVGKLEGVRQQIFQHLLQPLRVRRHAGVEPGIQLNVERQIAGLPPRAGTVGQ